MEFGCGCLGITVIIAILLIIAGLIDTFEKGRPDIGIPIIGVGVGIIVVIAIILLKIGRPFVKDISSGSNTSYSGVRPRVDSQGRFYCNACGGYVSRHDPSNHPECN